MWFDINVEDKQGGMMVKVITVKYPKTPTYNYTVLGKNNKHKPYLYNNISDFVSGKGIKTVFDMGKDKITMSTQSKKMGTIISKSLKRMGIVRELKK